MSRTPPSDLSFQYRHPLHGFPKLMPHRVRRLLLIASRYDSYLLGEDDRLNDLILSEFLDLNLGSSPWLTRISNGDRALAKATARGALTSRRSR